MGRSRRHSSSHHQKPSGRHSGRSRSRTPTPHEIHPKKVKLEPLSPESQRDVLKQTKLEPLSPESHLTEHLKKRVKKCTTSPTVSKQGKSARKVALKREERERNFLEDAIPGTSFSGIKEEHKVEGRSFDRREQSDYEKKEVEKEKPNFQPSGKLTEDTNMYKGVVIKYNEPSDARPPKTYWRLYPFKGDEGLPVMHIHRQSAYLIGRNPEIADIGVLHPSCSKQHAVLQYRLTSTELPDGTVVKKVRPYIIDLNSANGTYLNGERIEPQRFVELQEKDVLKFGFSSREYVLLRADDNGGKRKP